MDRLSGRELPDEHRVIRGVVTDRHGRYRHEADAGGLSCFFRPSVHVFFAAFGRFDSRSARVRTQTSGVRVLIRANRVGILYTTKQLQLWLLFVVVGSYSARTAGWSVYVCR